MLMAGAYITGRGGWQKDAATGQGVSLPLRPLGLFSCLCHRPQRALEGLNMAWSSQGQKGSWFAATPQWRPCYVVICCMECSDPVLQDPDSLLHVLEAALRPSCHFGEEAGSTPESVAAPPEVICHALHHLPCPPKQRNPWKWRPPAQTPHPKSKKVDGDR